MNTINKKDFSRIYELMSFEKGKTLFEMEQKWDNLINENIILEDEGGTNETAANNIVKMIHDASTKMTGTDTNNLLKAVRMIKDREMLKRINFLISTGLHGQKYNSLQSLLNDELGVLDGIAKDTITNHMRSIDGLGNGGIMTDLRTQPLDTKSTTKAAGQQSTTTPTNWPEQFACVTKLPNIQTFKLKDGGVGYQTNDGKVNYYNNGKKQVFKDGSYFTEKYDCNSPEFKNLPKTTSPKVQGSETTQPSQIQNTQGQTIKQKVEGAGLNWIAVKKEFGSSGTKEDNIKLNQAWNAGWRPGQEVKDEFQTALYKQNKGKSATDGNKVNVASDEKDIKNLDNQGKESPENLDNKGKEGNETPAQEFPNRNISTNEVLPSNPADYYKQIFNLENLENKQK
jgi:hypothetical protein